MSHGIHPLTGQPKNGKPRKELVEFFANQERLKEARRIEARYDAAQTTDANQNYWAAADAYDADSANRIDVRERLVPRSRYETYNNGYADGIAQTYATDLVGVGPQLRMQTGSEGFNRLVELAWFQWMNAVKFRRKLWCMAHAKHVDGEAFAVLRTNRNIRGPVKLDFVLHETEMCQTPGLPFQKDSEDGYIDGIKFDNFGNVQWYDFLKKHPGDSQSFGGKFLEAERVRPDMVAHWFKLRRPGQHRGIPESVSTLNFGAAARRWREAVINTAELVARYTLFLQTAFPPDEMDPVSPMSTLDVQNGMITALPAGFNAFQPKPEQPTATHETFHKTLINEQARPKSMPYNKAACDSSSYNYASGRLDHQTYYGSLDVERADCDDLVLDVAFDAWWFEAVQVYGWLGGNPDAIGDMAKAHLWDWPKHKVADVQAEASAIETQLRSAQTTLTQVYADRGLDFEDELAKNAIAYGVSVDDLRKLMLNAVFPGADQILNPPPAAQAPQPGGDGGQDNE